MADVYQDMQKAGMAILHRQTRWGERSSPAFQAHATARISGDSLTPSIEPGRGPSGDHPRRGPREYLEYPAADLSVPEEVVGKQPVFVLPV